MQCAIWYHLYNLKNVKNTHGGVLLLVKLQAEVCNFNTKSNTPPWVFFTFFKLYKWYQTAQRITNTVQIHRWTWYNRSNFSWQPNPGSKHQEETESTLCFYWPTKEEKLIMRSTESGYTKMDYAFDTETVSNYKSQERINNI